MPDPIPVHCVFEKMADAASLRSHPRNPNRHPTEQVELLAKIIKHQGWRGCIVVSNQSGFIVEGHCRLEAAKLLGLAEVPVDYQDFATEADELAHLIADNCIAKLAETDDKAFRTILKNLSAQSFDTALAGIISRESQSEIVELEVRQPPVMAWALIGIPITDFAIVQAMLDALPESATIKTTVTDAQPAD